MTNRARPALLAIATSARFRETAAKAVGRFGEQFDKWLFVWDESRFDEPAFSGCRIEQRRGYKKWDFARELLTPDVCEPYEFLFFWDDDLETSQFNPELFIEIMLRNQLELAQPALAVGSYFSHRITLQQPGIGRLTDFVEVMAPVYTRAAWRKWYPMMVPDNQWGWGYDVVARSACGYERMAIVDYTPVTHLQPLNQDPTRGAEMARFFAAHPHYERARGVVFGPLV
jgi:hypothetical protein